VKVSIIELNVRLRREIFRLQEEIGFTLLYVTHDRREAFEIATRIVVMSHGKIELTGPVAQIKQWYNKN